MRWPALSPTREALSHDPAIDALGIALTRSTIRLAYTQGNLMKNADTFLITYGLHSYVTHSKVGGQSVFTIGAPAGQKMIRHARTLLSGTFGNAAAIHVA